MERYSDGGEDQGAEEALWGRRRKNHHVSFGKSRLARAALPFQRFQTTRSEREEDSRTCFRAVSSARSLLIRSSSFISSSVSSSASSTESSEGSLSGGTSYTGWERVRNNGSLAPTTNTKRWSAGSVGGEDQGAEEAFMGHEEGGRIIAAVLTRAVSRESGSSFQRVPSESLSSSLSRSSAESSASTALGFSRSSAVTPGFDGPSSRKSSASPSTRPLPKHTKAHPDQRNPTRRISLFGTHNQGRGPAGSVRLHGHVSHRFLW